MKLRNKFWSMVACLTFVNACGTRDYATPPKESVAQREEKNIPAKLPPGTNAEIRANLVPKPPPKSGYIWGGLEWIGVPPSMILKLKCQLADVRTVSEFKALGSAIFGGAVIGVVVKYSGSWFFGKPAEAGPGHWFWNRLDETTKNVSQGALRGALFGGVCETALAGGNFTPFAGFLGQSFAALSSAVTLGVLSSIAATPYIEKLINQEPLPNDIPPSEVQAAREAEIVSETEALRKRRPVGFRAKMREWTQTTKIGRGLRYRVAPGIAIVGIGAGVGLLIYDSLSSDDPAAKINCEQEI